MLITRDRWKIKLCAESQILGTERRASKCLVTKIEAECVISIGQSVQIRSFRPRINDIVPILRDGDVKETSFGVRSSCCIIICLPVNTGRDEICTGVPDGSQQGKNSATADKNSRHVFFHGGRLFVIYWNVQSQKQRVFTLSIISKTPPIQYPVFTGQA
ncbi:MAG: hypothetical protein ACI87E_001674 [Mariniblastus sp.]|jgi:hypothetical protein